MIRVLYPGAETDFFAAEISLYCVTTSLALPTVYATNNKGEYNDEENILDSDLAGTGGMCCQCRGCEIQGEVCSRGTSKTAGVTNPRDFGRIQIYAGKTQWRTV
jgi:hypothetical protein